MLNSAYEFDDERPAEPELFFGCPDVDEDHRELVSRGVEIADPIITGYGVKQLYLWASDGYQLCFRWPA